MSNLKDLLEKSQLKRQEHFKNITRDELESFVWRVIQTGYLGTFQEAWDECVESGVEEEYSKGGWGVPMTLHDYQNSQIRILKENIDKLEQTITERDK